jgi:hypothetical protein
LMVLIIIIIIVEAFIVHISEHLYALNNRPFNQVECLFDTLKRN